MTKQFKLLIVAFFVVTVCSSYADAQEKDYYKFDDNGILVEFLLTTPDGVKITYDWANRNGGILYPDGTQIDYSKSLTEAFDGPRIWPNTNKYDIIGALPIKDWYKDLRKATSAPTGAAMMDDVFGINEITIIFPDNSQATVVHKDSGNYIQEYVDICENGDRLCVSRGNVTIINLKNPLILDPVTGEIRSRGRLVSGSMNNQKLMGMVITEDGNTFNGSFRIKYNVGEYQKGENNVRNYSPKSSYLNSLSKGNPEDYMIWPRYGIDNIVGIYLENGRVINKNNKIIAMYKNAQQLDEFDMAAELAAEQGKLDREKAAAKKAASEKAAITSKYGQKYANAFFAGKVIVGMPWSLVEIGLDANSFNEFYTALLSFERQTASGNKMCYQLIGDDLRTVGTMWVVNGVVQSIIYY